LYSPEYYQRQIALTILVIVFFLSGALLILAMFSLKPRPVDALQKTGYCIDRGNRLSYDDVRSDPSLFRESPQTGVFNLGFIRHPVWIRLVVGPVPTAGVHYLSIGEPVDEILFWNPGEEVPGLAGRMIPPHNVGDDFLSMKSQYLFPLRFREGQSLVCYMKVRNHGIPLILPVKLYNEKSAAYLTSRTTFFAGLLIGFLLLVLILNLLFYFIFQERDYLLFSIYLGTISLALLGFNGITDLLTGPAAAAFNYRAGVFFLPLTYMMAGLYINHFIALKTVRPGLNRILWIFLSLCPVLSVLSLFHPLIHTVLLVEYLMAVPLAVFYFFVIVRYTDKKHIAAYFFMAGWSVLGVGIILGVLKDSTLIAYNMLTDNLIWISLVIHSFLMFMAISDRVRFDEEQKDAAEKKVIRERNRIAAEIHDSVGADFSVFVQEMMVDPGRSYPAREISERLKFYLDRIRDIVYMLNRDYDLPERLEKEMEAQLNRLKNLGLLEIESRIEPLGKVLGIEKSYHLLRIYNEWIANIIKHSGADRIRVDFYREKTRVLLKVASTGRGINWVAGTECEGITEGQGLRNIGWRCRSIRAQASSTPDGDRYLFIVSIPVKDRDQETP
jgi:signal transduction histidine kinase